MKPRVVIVGAGVLGLSAAVELGLDGKSEVTLIDREHPGAGSSSLSAGVFTSQYLTEPDIEIRAWSLRRFAELEQTRGLNLRRIGLLRFARDARTLADYRYSAQTQRDYGIQSASVIDPEEVAALLPHYEQGELEGALYSPVDGYMDGGELCSLLAEWALELGVSIRGGTALTGMRRGGAESKYVLTTNRGEIPADLICNCAGAWAEQVGELLEAPWSVVNERHEAFIFELPERIETVYPVVLDNVPGNDAGGAALYFRAEGERQLITGLHSNSILGHPVEDPDDYFRGVTQDSVDEIVARLADAFPELPDIGYRTGWAGLYPHSSSQRPVLGPHPDNEDVLIGAGLGGIGLSLGPALGRLLADWVAFGAPRALSCGPDLMPRADETGSAR